MKRILPSKSLGEQVNSRKFRQMRTGVAASVELVWVHERYPNLHRLYRRRPSNPATIRHLQALVPDRERMGWTNSPNGTTLAGMEPKKYSTGTKGRIKMHSDKCKEFIRVNTSFSLATEFITTIDPDRDERVWQRFQAPTDILPELQEWLGVEVVKPAAPSATKPPIHPNVKPASQLLQDPETVAMQKTRAWLASSAGQEKIASLAPLDAAELALQRLYRELTGREENP